MPGELKDGPGDVSCGVMSLLFPTCIPVPIILEDKETVIIEV